MLAHELRGSAMTSRAVGKYPSGMQGHGIVALMKNGAAHRSGSC